MSGGNYMKGMGGNTGTFMHYAEERIFDWPSKENIKHIQVQKRRDEKRLKMLEENERLSFDKKKSNNTVVLEHSVFPHNKKSKPEIEILYRIGMKVVHVEYGEGVVTAVYSHRMSVRFLDRNRGVKDFDIKTINKAKIIMPLEMAKHKKDLRR